LNVAASIEQLLYLGSNSAGSICGGFVLQLDLQQIRNKFTISGQVLRYQFDDKMMIMIMMADNMHCASKKRH